MIEPLRVSYLYGLVASEVDNDPNVDLISAVPNGYYEDYKTLVGSLHTDWLDTEQGTVWEAELAARIVERLAELVEGGLK